MPTIVSVAIVNAFVDGTEGGNPAGVVLHADTLTTAQKLFVAAQVGLSETAFISQSNHAAFKLEFFTPTRQIAHCGHATVATFSLLRQRGLIDDGRTSKETIDGNRNILIDGTFAFIEQSAPVYAELSPEQERAALKSLGLGAGALIDGLRPCVVNTSNSFLLLPLQNEADLAALTPDLAIVEELSEALNLIGFYAFARTENETMKVATTRMFAPRYGINEESATGTAAGPLACFLYDRTSENRITMQVEQGRLMNPPSPSVLSVRLKVHDGKIETVTVGGQARVVSVIEIEI